MQASKATQQDMRNEILNFLPNKKQKSVINGFVVLFNMFF